MRRRAFLQTMGTGAACSLGTYWLSKRSRFSGSSYIQMGTSVTGGLDPSAAITPAIVGNRLDMPGINAGVPGACAGTHKFPEINYRDLYSLVDAITSGDWAMQKAANTAPLKEPIFRLMTADLSKPTYLGLEYGTNDFSYGRPLGMSTDTTCGTFKGALNYSLAKLSTEFPEVHMFLITPAWLLNFENRDSDTYPNEIGVHLKEYVDGMIEIAALHHVPCLDMWRNLGVNFHNYKKFTFDGTHPRDICAARRGELIASFMNSVF
jgi:hypothetical protein